MSVALFSKLYHLRDHSEFEVQISYHSGFFWYKTWSNTKSVYFADEYFKTHCHPKCLTSCVSSCMPGCCREHDKVSVKTGLAKHCHASCLTNCLPSCGSGCCSADEERKRGHHFLHYQRIKDYHKAKDEAASKQHDQPKKDTKKLEDKVNPKCHPQCKETCISSCGKGCCTDEGERLRDENERKMKDQQEKYRKEKQKKLLEMYKPQPRLCPAPCPQVNELKIFFRGIKIEIKRFQKFLIVSWYKGNK